MAYFYGYVSSKNRISSILRAMWVGLLSLLVSPRGLMYEQLKRHFYPALGVRADQR